jgi:hypothetical protein
MNARSAMTAPAAAPAAVRRYRFVLMTSIVLNVAVAFFIIFQPDAFTNLLQQPEAFPKTWPRHWGYQLLAINGLYLPGFRNPIEQRWPNWMGIAIRITFALFFLSQGDGFVLMGIYDGISGLLLLATYVPVVRAAERRLEREYDTPRHRGTQA